MLLSIDKAKPGSTNNHRLLLISNSTGDEKLLQQLVDSSYTLAGYGMDPETNKLVHVSIALELSDD